MADPLDDFERSSFTAEGATRPVLRTGSGPAVIVMSEIPGITPNVARFARMVAGIGCTAVVPHLFGVDGKEPSVPYALQSMVGACVSKEFTVLALGRSSPITTWLRALARSEHERCGGPGVGAVGMCLTGGFALAMMVDDVVLAPVLSQPSLPFPMGRARRRALGISDADAERVRERVAAGVCVLGLRFTGDRVSPHERFAALSELLGDGFVGVELDSSPGNPYGHRKSAHSVLTEDLDDRPGTPTREALDQVLDLFRTRLVS
jgi:dienelactone hydrolase